MISTVSSETTSPTEATLGSVTVSDDVVLGVGFILRPDSVLEAGASFVVVDVVLDDKDIGAILRLELVLGLGIMPELDGCFPIDDIPIEGLDSVLVCAPRDGIIDLPAVSVFMSDVFMGTASPKGALVFRIEGCLTI
mgnify:CR=1 FL=1|tara:strand:+ start:798 stop:1208 length:411 start_codon:yes stop_codon:yes gene_type:complete